MEDRSDVARTISSIIRTHPKQSVVGSDLVILIRQKHPDFRPLDYDCRNVREFVRRFVADVYESARKGLDIVYSPSPVVIMSSTTAAQQPQETTQPREDDNAVVDAQVWKTFVSPNSEYRLFVHPITRAFRMMHAKTETPEAPWIEVPPCPPATHLDIARRFVATLPEGEAKTRLTGALYEGVWWVPFFALARALKVDKEWNAFRTRELRAELRRTVTSLGVMFPAGVGFRMEQPQTEAVAARSAGSDLVKRLAHSAIDKMSEADLRELRLPLGVIIDELRQR